MKNDLYSDFLQMLAKSWARHVDEALARSLHKIFLLCASLGLVIVQITIEGDCEELTAHRGIAQELPMCGRNLY